MSGIIGSAADLIGVGSGDKTTTNTSNVDNSNYNDYSIHNTGLQGGDVSAIARTQADAINEAQRIAQDANTAEGIQQTKRLNDALNAGTLAVNTLSAANVQTTAAILDAQKAAAAENARVAINQANATQEVMIKSSDNQKQIALANISKDIALAQVSANERTSMAVLNSDERKYMENLNANERAAALNKTVDGLKYLAALNADSNETSQANLTKLAAQNNASMAHVANASIEAMSKLNRANDMAREASAAAAAENQIKLLGAVLGPNGIQGIMGTQNDALQNQQAQMNRLILEQANIAAAQQAKTQQLAATIPADDVVGVASKKASIDSLNKIINQSIDAIQGMSKVVAIQAKNPELLNRPTSEIMAALAAEVITKSSQDCRGGVDSTMTVVIGGTNNTIRDNKILQKNKFNSSCFQDVSKTADIQQQMSTTLKQIMSLQSKTVNDELGMDTNQINQKVDQDVKNSFTSETLQKIANQANSKMDITIGGDNNIVESNVIQQSNDIIFEAAQKETQKINIVQGIAGVVDSKLDSKKIITGEQAAAAKAAAAKASSTTNAVAPVAPETTGTNPLVYVAVVVVLLMIIGGVVFVMKQNSAEEYVEEIPEEQAVGGSIYHGNGNYYGGFGMPKINLTTQEKINVGATIGIDRGRKLLESTGLIEKREPTLQEKITGSLANGIDAVSGSFSKLRKMFS